MPNAAQFEPEPSPVLAEMQDRLRQVSISQLIGGMLVVSALGHAAEKHYIRAGVQGFIGLKLLNE